MPLTRSLFFPQIRVGIKRAAEYKLFKRLKKNPVTPEINDYENHTDGASSHHLGTQISINNNNKKFHEMETLEKI